MKQCRLIKEMVLQTIPVVLKEGNQRMVFNTLLDDGSTKNVNEDVATELRLKRTIKQLQVNIAKNVLRPLAKKVKHLGNILCGYFDWNRLHRVTLCI